MVSSNQWAIDSIVFDSLEHLDIDPALLHLRHVLSLSRRKRQQGDLAPDFGMVLLMIHRLEQVDRLIELEMKEKEEEVLN